MSYISETLCEDITRDKRFGICDDNPHQRAYININDGSKWMAVVQNENRKEVIFTALDHCIEMRRANGKMESRCEGVITCDDTIIFVEVKERIGDARTWVKEADKQLRNSISLIESRINLDKFPIKKASITNRLQRGSKQKHSVRMRKFLEDTGYVLRVDNRIIIE
jgi:hypothetical protein